MKHKLKLVSSISLSGSTYVWYLYIYSTPKKKNPRVNVLNHAIEFAISAFKIFLTLI